MLGLLYSRLKNETPNALGARGSKNGAEDEIRTRDPRLGKAMLYH